MSKLILFDDNNNIILTKDGNFPLTGSGVLDDNDLSDLVNVKLLDNNKFVSSDYYTAIRELQLDSGNDYKIQPVRHFFLNSDADKINVVSRARQLAFWDRDHQFCGRCGAATISLTTEYAKECIDCKYRFYPRITPCILAAVVKNDKILLGRAPHFPPGVYSLLAGFVEVGETCEATVAREVFEEVGVSIENVRYFGSQSWPFPHSMMLAFVADYVEGNIVVDKTELEDARWFTFEGLRQCPDLLPAKASLSRTLLDTLIKNTCVS